jgi:inner membrane protein
MIIGHLPAGYIASKILAKKLTSKTVNLRLFILVGMCGAVAPDFDLFYFYFVDQRQYHHHTYWPHYPVAWLSMLLISIIWCRIASYKSTALLGLIFSINGSIHMLLDSIVGDIWWFSPFLDESFAMFTVPALHEPWWLNFILHWSFLLEIFILGWSILMYSRSRRLVDYKGWR